MFLISPEIMWIVDTKILVGSVLSLCHGQFSYTILQFSYTILQIAEDQNMNIISFCDIIENSPHVQIYIFDEFLK